MVGQGLVAGSCQILPIGIFLLVQSDQIDAVVHERTWRMVHEMHGVHREYMASVHD